MTMDVLLETAASVLRDVRTDLQKKRPVQIKMELVKFAAGLDVITQAIERKKELIEDPKSRMKLFQILNGIEYDSPENSFATIAKAAEKNPNIVKKWVEFMRDDSRMISELDRLGRSIASDISLLKNYRADVRPTPVPSANTAMPMFI